jgi:hypothetical protein
VNNEKGYENEGDECLRLLLGQWCVVPCCLGQWCVVPCSFQLWWIWWIASNLNLLFSRDIITVPRPPYPLTITPFQTQSSWWRIRVMQIYLVAIKLEISRRLEKHGHTWVLHTVLRFEIGSYKLRAKKPVTWNGQKRRWEGLVEKAWFRFHDWLKETQLHHTNRKECVWLAEKLRSWFHDWLIHILRDLKLKNGK